MLIPGKETKEERQHCTAYIPYSFYFCRIPTDFANVPMHWHSEFELNYVVRGQGDFTCGGEKYRAGEGSIMFLPPNMLHSAYHAPDRDLQYYALVFSPVLLGASLGDRCALEFLRPIINGSRRLPIYILPDGTDYPELHEAVQKIFACAQDQTAQADLLLRAELLRLIWILSTGRESAPQSTSANGETLRPALEYLLNHYHEPVTIGQLARIAHLSENYFMGLFKRTVGLSAMDYLNQLRINAACEALISTDRPISEIAFSVGFGNLSNFNRQFKRSMGCTPRSFRDNTGNQKSGRHVSKP